jgi:hypothetical protein
MAYNATSVKNTDTLLMSVAQDKPHRQRKQEVLLVFIAKNSDILVPSVSQILKDPAFEGAQGGHLEDLAPKEDLLGELSGEMTEDLPGVIFEATTEDFEEVLGEDFPNLMETRNAREPWLSRDATNAGTMGTSSPIVHSTRARIPRRQLDTRMRHKNHPIVTKYFRDNTKKCKQKNARQKNSN